MSGLPPRGHEVGPPTDDPAGAPHTDDPAGEPHPADAVGEPPPARRPSLWRTVFYTASAALLVWAAFVVPLPLIEYVPGPPSEIAPLVEIEGVDTTELQGSTALLTVVLRQQPLAPTLRAVLSRDRELLRVSEVFPPDLDRDRYLEQQRERFGRQFDIAAAMGAQAAGFEPQLATEVVVVDVIPDAPADGLLVRGDVLLAVDGVELGSAEELQTRARESRVGDELTLSVLRRGEPLTVAVTLGRIEASPFPVIGIAVETAVDRLVLPFEVQLAEGTRIGGPSAGMMVGITVYDLLAEEDLLGGLAVAGTGTLDADARVGPVGGVPQKLQAAAELGADLVLVPAAQLELAMATAPDGLQVMGVANLEQALEAIRTVRDAPGRDTSDHDTPGRDPAAVAARRP